MITLADIMKAAGYDPSNFPDTPIQLQLINDPKTLAGIEFHSVTLQKFEDSESLVIDAEVEMVDDEFEFEEEPE